MITSIFLFIHKVLKIQHVFFTLNTHQFGPATTDVLNGQRSLYYWTIWFYTIAPSAVPGAQKVLN